MAHSYLFPELYSAWLAKRLPGVVTETLATCDNCVMVKPVGLTRDPGPFAANLKCCTYFPFVPNFSLGSMLIEKPHEVQVPLQSASSQGILLPIGLFASPERQALLEELGNDGFGKRADLLCPFYDSVANGCSVWKQRPGVCTSYFCKSDRGQKGLDFWSDIEAYLNHFEWALASEVFQRIGFTEDDMEMCKATMICDEPIERMHFVREAWGSWFDRKDELLKLSFKLASEISADELDGILDDEHLALEADLRSRI
jgi:Fe-S-cluster containining protein